MSRAAFGASDGLTVVAWGRAPLNQPLQQRWSMGLAREAPSDGHPTRETQDLPALLRVNGPDGAAAARFAGRGRPAGLGSVAAPGPWHRYGVQVTPEGRVWVAVYDRPLYRLHVPDSR